MTDTKQVTITKTSLLYIVKSLLREADTCLSLFLLDYGKSLRSASSLAS